MDIADVTKGALDLFDRFKAFRDADLNGRIGMRLDRAQELIQSGDLDATDFQTVLRLAYGNSVNAAFSADGSVDYEALQTTISATATERLNTAVDRGLEATEFGVESGLLPAGLLRAGLYLRYGDTVNNAFSDGSVDFDRIKQIILAQAIPAEGDAGEATESGFSATA